MRATKRVAEHLGRKAFVVPIRIVNIYPRKGRAVGGAEVLADKEGSEAAGIDGGYVCSTRCVDFLKKTFLERVVKLSYFTCVILGDDV